MITLIGRLCGLCAMSALLEMMLPQDGGREGMRTVCGLMMLHMTLMEGRSAALGIANAQSLEEMIRILIG